MTRRTEPATTVKWQYYRTHFSRPPTEQMLQLWGWDEPEGWWAAEDRQEAVDFARTFGDGTIRSQVIHHTYDDWKVVSVD